LAIGVALARAEVPVEHSFSAGTYVCNHLLYGLLHRAAVTGSAVRIGFLHLPLLPLQVPARKPTPSLPLAAMVAGVRRALEVCAASVGVGQEADLASGREQLPVRTGPIQEVRDARVLLASQPGGSASGAGGER
jgi:hypothetical protein